MSLAAACAQQPQATAQPSPTPDLPTRSDSIPQDAVKMRPQEDDHPPILHVEGWSDPVPLPGPINTAGAEDSPFVSPDGRRFFFFFTPDVRVPVEKQILDGVTGIYVSTYLDGDFGAPERVLLQVPGKLALDGCHFFDGTTLWFCSAREGYTGLHWFKAELVNNHWGDWRMADFDPMYQVGELHIHDSALYFHSARDGGHGGTDIWVSRNVDGVWQAPVNVHAVNSEANEGWPFVTQDEHELWFNRTYQGTPAVFRSNRVDGEWTTPELILSQFAGEPTLDPQGNIYFVHHYFQDGEMIEADIYVAYRE
jgi:hypothetical protein